MPGWLPISFGPLLKAARRRRQWVQRQLAQRLGVHVNTIGAWERGDHLPATRGLVLELAQPCRAWRRGRRSPLVNKLSSEARRYSKAPDIPKPELASLTSVGRFAQRLQAKTTPAQACRNV